MGELLRHWRATRRLSQLALALEAATTARHLSFIESGRSQPSPEMVLRLARALDVPIRERNQLLLAAGYAPLYREAGLDSAQAAQVRAALRRMLAAHEPFPAVVMDRHWNVVTANSAADAFFGWLLGEREAGEPANVIRLMFDPGGLRPFVANWEAAAEALISASTAKPWAAFPIQKRSRCSPRSWPIQACLPGGSPPTSGHPHCRSSRSSSTRTGSR